VRCGRSILLLALAVAVAGATPASAHDHRVPSVKLHVGDEAQGGGLLYYTWLRRSGEFCVSEHGDGAGGFPAPLDVSPGTHTARLVFRKRQRPRTVRLRAWRDVESGGQPRGPGETLRARLAPRKGEDGLVDRWVARFELRLGPDYYIHAFARWRDEDRCGTQELLRAYHVSAR
jgi:hypothetical protein